SEKESGHISRRISEHGQLGPTGHLGWWKDGPAAQFLNPIERCFQIVHLGIDRNALPAVVGRAYSTVNASRSAPGIDDAILHRVVAVDLPPEEFAVEPFELIALSAHNFEMNNRRPH